jgi:xanthine dehydrogenase large subunit
MARVSLSATGYYRTPEIYYDRERASGRPFLYYACGAAVSEVVIDTLTGEYKLLRVDILHDVGNSINRQVDVGQIEGGFIQGLGWLTTEELKWSSEGRLLTDSPATYKIPAIGDAPIEFNVSLLKDSPNAAQTVMRSKAVGEPPLMLALSAFSAIRQAIAACAANEQFPALNSPATPEEILGCIRAVSIAD